MNPPPVLDDITIVIPTLGRDLLRGCLEAIAAGSHLPALVIVVDQSSSSRIGEWARELSGSGLEVLHVPSKERGVSAGRNRGLERVQTRFVAFTDDDCRVAEDWLFQLVTLLRAQPDQIVSGRVEGGGEASLSTPFQQDTVHRRPGLRGNVLYPNNMGCALDVFERVGPFDERSFLRYAEDNDWDYRALRSGIAIHWSPLPRISHLDWRDDAELDSTLRAYAYSEGGVYGKFIRRGDAFMVLRVAVSLLRAFLRLLRSHVQADEAARINAWAFLTRLLPGVAAGWRDSQIGQEAAIWPGWPRVARGESPDDAEPR
jgi:GT2 family glycosyltransferase